MAGERTTSALRRGMGVVLRPSWVDLTKSLFIDFANKRAHRNGVILNIPTLVTSGRASGGMKYDGFNWIAAAPNELRYLDGTGLLVEEERTNSIRNNNGAGVAPPSTKPTTWGVNLLSGLTATYGYGVENGLPFVDIRVAGTTPSNSGFNFDFENNLSTVFGDNWTHSDYIAIVGGSLANINTVRTGGRAGQAGGGGTEFPTGPDFKSELTRYLKRFSYSFPIANANSISVAPRLSFAANASVAIDVTVRIAAPQMEKGLTATSPILTVGGIGTRPADSLTVAMPPGTHDVTVTFDDGTTQIFSGITGNWSVPPLNKTVVRSISAVRTDIPAPVVPEAGKYISYNLSIPGNVTWIS